MISELNIVFRNIILLHFVAMQFIVFVPVRLWNTMNPVQKSNVFFFFILMNDELG